jgi:hypothetical protein
MVFWNEKAELRHGTYLGSNFRNLFNYSSAFSTSESPSGLVLDLLI